jgi:hypothetical protein
MLSVSIKTLVRNTAYKRYSARGSDGVAAFGALAERAMGQELTLGEMPWSCPHPGADCNSVESGAVGAVADRAGRAPKGVRKDAGLMTGYRARLQWAGSTQMRSALVASLRRREKECDHPFVTKRIVRPCPRQCTFLIAEERLGDLRLRFRFTPPMGQSGDEVSTRGIAVGRTVRHQPRCPEAFQAAAQRRAR